jgi:hypothetical protein
MTLLKYVRKGPWDGCKAAISVQTRGKRPGRVNSQTYAMADLRAKAAETTGKVVFDFPGIARGVLIRSRCLGAVGIYAGKLDSESFLVLTTRNAVSAGKGRNPTMGGECRQPLEA